jgi:hypothetical protein
VIFANDPGQSPIVSADKNLDITEQVVLRLRSTKGPAVVAPKTNPSPTGPAGVTRPPSRP